MSLATAGMCLTPPPLLNHPSAIFSSAGGASEIDRPFPFVIYIVIVFSSRSADVMRSGALADTTAALGMRVKNTSNESQGGEKKITTDTNLYSSHVSANMCV